MKEPRERRTIRVHPKERASWRAAVELDDEKKSISRFVAESAVTEAKRVLETGEAPPQTWFENLPLKENRFFSLFLTASEESLILRAAKKAEIGFSDFVRRAASNHSPYAIAEAT